MYCNIPGHVEKKFWSKNGRRDWATKASSSQGTRLESVVNTSVQHASNTVTLTNEDFESLLKLAHGESHISTASKACLSTREADPNMKWLIDFGASDI